MINSFAELPDSSNPWEEISKENIQEITLPYVPRPFQEVLHSRLARFNVLICHRRFGKTVFAIMEMIDRALRNELTNPQYAYIAPPIVTGKQIGRAHV